MWLFQKSLLELWNSGVFMTNLYIASNYKNTIINLLLKNKDFVTLMNPPKSPHNNISTEDMLLGGVWFFNGKKYEEQGQIFDHNFVDETTTEQKTFVFVETDIDMIRQNLFTDFNLYVCVFTDKSLIRITDDTIPSINDVEIMGYNCGHYGNRVDILCDVVDRILNGNQKIKGIGDVEPAQRGFCTIYSPSNKYYGKCLKYTISSLNEMEDNCENY